MVSDSLGVMSSKERRSSPEIRNLVELRIEGQVSLHGHQSEQAGGAFKGKREKSQRYGGLGTVVVGRKSTAERVASTEVLRQGDAR